MLTCASQVFLDTYSDGDGMHYLSSEHVTLLRSWYSRPSPSSASRLVEFANSSHRAPSGLHCTSTRHNGAPTWRLQPDWAAAIRSGQYDGLLVMRPDTLLRAAMRTVLAHADLSDVTFPFRVAGCPPIGASHVGDSPLGNPRVMDSLLWVPRHILRNESLSGSMQGWFRCHDALDAMPSALPVNLLIPGAYAANTGWGYNPLFTLTGHEPFPFGRHPWCCVQTREGTKRVDCWERTTRLRPRNTNGSPREPTRTPSGEYLR